MIFFTTVGVIGVAILARFFFPSTLICVAAFVLSTQGTMNIINYTNTIKIFYVAVWSICFMTAIVWDLKRIWQIKEGKLKYHD